MGQEKLILGHDKMNDGTKQCDVWDRISRSWVITRENYGTEKGGFGGQEQLILGHN